MESDGSSLIFITTAYPSKHAKVSATGWADTTVVTGWDSWGGEKIQWGETLPVTFNLNVVHRSDGVQRSVGTVTTAPCDGACPGVPDDRVHAWGYQYSDLEVGSDPRWPNGDLQIVTPVVKDAGTLVSIRNELTGDQSILDDDLESLRVYEYNCVDEQGRPGTEGDGRCVGGNGHVARLTGANGDYTVRTALSNAFIRLSLPMRLNGSGPWSDTVTVSTPDMTRQQRVTIQPFVSTVGGGGTGGTPSSPASTPAGSATQPTSSTPAPLTKQSAAPSVATGKETDSSGTSSIKPVAQASKGAPSSTEAATPTVGSTGGSPSTSVTAPSKGASGSSVQASTKPAETARPATPSAPPKQVGPKVKQVGPKVETDQVGTTGSERVGLWAAVSTLAMAGLGGGVIARRRRSNS